METLATMKNFPTKTLKLSTTFNDFRSEIC